MRVDRRALRCAYTGEAMKTNKFAGPVIPPDPGAEDREKIRGALAHLREHGNLNGFAASRSEKIAIVTTARREGLLAARGWGYRLTSRGRRYSGVPGRRKTGFSRLVVCLGFVAALAGSSYAIVQLRTDRINTAAVAVPQQAAAPAAVSPAASRVATHEADPAEFAPLPASETTGRAVAAEPAVQPTPEAAPASPAPAKKVVKRKHPRPRSKVGMDAAPRYSPRWTQSVQNPLF